MLIFTSGLVNFFIHVSSFALHDTFDITKELLGLLFPIIEKEDPELYQFLLKSEVQPYFALSWLITWFSHGFDDLDSIARLFDFFLASHPVMPLYLSAQVCNFTCNPVGHYAFQRQTLERSRVRI